MTFDTPVHVIMNKFYVRVNSSIEGLGLAHKTSQCHGAICAKCN